MSIEVVIWVLGGVIGVIGMLVATLWQMTRAEQKAQDAAIEQVRQHKADKVYVEDGEKRWSKEIDRIRFEHDKVIDRIEGRFEKELESVKDQLGERITTMEDNLLRSMTAQFNLVMEMLKKDKP